MLNFVLIIFRIKKILLHANDNESIEKKKYNYF